MRSNERQPWRRLAPSFAGPALILLAVLALLHGFWLFARLTNQHVDVMAYWLPRWCYLGKSLANGDLPTWLPNQAGGVPFLSDPQSGWLNLVPMAFFTVTSCTQAIGWVIVAQPLIAGLAMYGFFRREGLGRPAATAGGLTLALAVSGSVAVLSMPFSAALAWTAVALWGAAGYLHADRASSRVAWLALCVFGLAQVAAAHPTNGLVIGMATTLVYVVARSIAQVRAGIARVGPALGRGVAIFVSFVPLSAAVLLPRLILSPRTALARGYRELDQMAAQLSGHPAPSALAVHGSSPWWGTSFARGPGGYVGALAILLIPVAFSSRRWRLPAAGFALLGMIGWASNLDWVVRARPIRSAALSTRLGELWLRDPERFQYFLLLAFAALAAYGCQSWLDARRTGWRSAVWFLPSVLVFGLLPILWGSAPGRSLLLAAGTVVMVPLLLVGARGHRWAVALLPVMVAAELTASGLIGQAGPVHQLQPLRQVVRQPGTHPPGRFGTILLRLERPVIVPSTYTTPGPIARELMAGRSTFGRYLTLDPRIAVEPRGFLLHQDPSWWPAYENGRSILFGLDEVQGYLSVQLVRYWMLVRSVDRIPIFYNASTLQSAPPGVLELFGVRWLILPRDQAGPAGALAVATEGRFVLYELPRPEPRASVVFDWEQVPPGQALGRVLRPGFDPESLAVLESLPEIDGTPVLSASGQTGSWSAEYRQISPESVRVEVSAGRRAVLVVRNAFDRNWRVSIDGKPARVQVVDGMMQAVPIPAGSHVVELSYRDDWIGLSFLLSAVAWTVTAALYSWLRRRKRQGRHVAGARSAQDPDGLDSVGVPVAGGDASSS